MDQYQRRRSSPPGSSRIADAAVPDTLAARLMSAGSFPTDGNATCLASFVAKQVWNGSKRPLSCASRIALPPDAFGNALPEFMRQLCPTACAPRSNRGAAGRWSFSGKRWLPAWRYASAPRRRSGDSGRVSARQSCCTDGVEPHKPQQSVSADTGEQIRDLHRCRLQRTRRLSLAMSIGSLVRARTATTVGPTKEDERQRGLGVVAVDPDPGHIGLPPHLRQRITNANPCFNDVDRRQEPGNVPGACLTEQGYDVPPAATNTAGEACPSAQEYQEPFISCPKLRMTGCP